MCRFFIYIGSYTCIYPFLYQHDHNLLRQCLSKVYSPSYIHENPRDHTINIDGFGIAIYNNMSDEPFVYKIVNRVWEDINLKRISKAFKSTKFLAHIRGVKFFQPNIPINQVNCHPFKYKDFIFCHNGDINSFITIKQKFINSINPILIKKILGQTDSEFLFFLILQQFPDLNQNYNSSQLLLFIIASIRKVIQFTDNKPSSLNLCFSSKDITIITRFLNSHVQDPPSLYYRLYNTDVIISSEPLSKNDHNWILVPKNNYILIENDNVTISKIDVDY